MRVLSLPVRSRTMQLLCLLLLCLALSACSDEKNMSARTESLAAFSITLPEGWVTNIPDGMECTASRCVAGFAHAPSGSQSAVTVSVVPSLGKKLEEIAEESRQNMASHDAVMKEKMRTETRVEYEGTIKESPARLIATLDAASQQVGILLLVGENEQTKAIVQSIRMKNPALDFAGQQ